MRPSNRTAIIEAAHRVAERQGGADFSYETTASEAGLTKAGVLYHFPSREDLVLAVVEFVASAWEDAMLRALGRPFEEATPAQRIRAYVEVAAGDDVSRADFAIYADAVCRPAHVGPWNEVFSRWFDLTGCTAEERARLTCARFAADGLWVAKATGTLPPSAAEHEALVVLLMALTDEQSSGQSFAQSFGQGRP
jgi:AcrR family transcriptional regulator